MLYWLTLVEIHLGLDIPSIFQLIFKPNTHAVKRESNLFHFISLPLSPQPPSFILALRVEVQGVD